jgi:asparagine synthase (glutamine-hydrolysing)
VFRDLAADGRWLTLLTQTVLGPPLYSSQSAASFLWEALRAAVPPGLRGLYRRLRPRCPPAAPDWLGPRLRRPWHEAVERPAERFRQSSCTRRHTWTWLTSPALWWSVEFQVARAARRGLEMRFPFLDRRLADFVLALPYQHRLPGGKMKRLLRDAMDGLLPVTIARRRHVTTFDCLMQHGLERDRELCRDLLFGTEWLSAPYVDQKAARQLFQQLDNPVGGLDYPQLMLARDIVQLEGWLRAAPDSSRSHP